MCIRDSLTGTHYENTDSNALIDQQNTSIKVYKVDNAADLSESYFVNPENFEDVTNLSLIHISEPTRHAQIAYAVFCLKKKKKKKNKKA
ncbi:hypothetical protein JMUB7527_28470 [Staphylococcus aureus]